MLVEYALERRIAHGKDDGGVGLQRHVLVEAVDVDAGDAGQFRLVFALFDHDGGQGTDFLPCQAHGSGLGVAFGRPELQVFLVHALQEVVGRDGPPYFIGIGDEHPDEGFGREAVAGGVLRIAQGCLEVVCGSFQLLTQEVREAVEAAEVTWDHQPHRRLPTLLQCAHDGLVAQAGLEAVEADVHALEHEYYPIVAAQLCDELDKSK